MAPLRDDHLAYRLGWFIRLRWLATAGFLPGVAGFVWLFDFRVNWVPFFIVAALMALINGAYTIYYRQRWPRLPETDVVCPQAIFFAHVQVIVDLLLLSTIIYLLGAIRYPFYFFYVFHIVIAALLLTPTVVVVYATVSLALFGGVLVLEYHLPTAALGSGACPVMGGPGSYVQQVSALVLVLLAGFYIAAYVALSIKGSLQRRQDRILELQQALEVEHQALTAYSQARERFMSVAFHDLKAPLAAVDAYLSVLVDDIGHRSPEEKQQMLERMAARIQQVQRFLKDLRDYSEIELGHRVAEPEPIDLRDILAETQDIVQPLAEARGLAFSVVLPAEPVRVSGVRIRLLEMVNNLCSNGVKFTEHGGVTVTLAAAGDRARIAVQDTGPGIPKSELGKIFEDFYRGLDSKKKRIEGSGIGLAVARKIAEGLGGRIEVTSEVGKGTEFVVDLPLAT